MFGSLLLVLKPDDDFDGDINDIVWAASFIFNQYNGYFEETIPRYLPYDFKHHVRIEWRNEHSEFSREINRLQGPVYMEGVRPANRATRLTELPGEG